ncbi:unnamed protein product [Lactuca virosa]|uniref:Potassium channel n=1 Tax=Lactuca virosa TaxID=75947 RepID=A0AAU9NGD9_9ASTR|nr:unnamed protein product [Lactuca virosa]
MATVGYGDIHAVNLREMIFVMVYVLFDMVLGAYLVGNITALVVKGSTREIYRERIKNLLKYMDRNRLGRDIRDDIKYHLQLPYDRTHTDSADFKDLPTSIRSMITETLYKPHIEKVPLFKGCSLEFINQIVSRVHEEFFPPGKIIMEQGSVVDQIYFICHGKLEEVVVYEGGPEEEISILNPHDSFGDVSILCNIPLPYTIRVHESCLLLKLDHQSFSNILKIYFHDKQKILNNLLEGKESDVHMKDMVRDIKTHIGFQDAQLSLRVNISVYNGDLFELKSLIRAGADPNKKLFDGRSPLHLAVSKGHEDIVVFLIQEGVDVDISDNFGNTPLLEAVKRGYDNIASLLIKESNSLMINSKDYDLRTPLHVATSQGSYVVAKLLVESGASVLSKDRWGNTPLDEARLSGNMILMKLLEEAKSFQMLEFPSCSQEPRDKMSRKKCTVYEFHPWELKDERKYGVVLWVPDTIDELMKTAAKHLKLELSTGFCIVTEDVGKIVDVNMITDGQKLYLITMEA